MALPAAAAAICVRPEVLTTPQLSFVSKELYIFLQAESWVQFCSFVLQLTVLCRYAHKHYSLNRLLHYGMHAATVMV